MSAEQAAIAHVIKIKPMNRFDIQLVSTGQAGVSSRFVVSSAPSSSRAALRFLPSTGLDECALRAIGLSTCGTTNLRKSAYIQTNELDVVCRAR